MLICTATNVTPGGLARCDGTADYEVWVGINHHRIWAGEIKRHVRDKGAAELLRIIATRMDEGAPLRLKFSKTMEVLFGNVENESKTVGKAKRKGTQKGAQASPKRKRAGKARD